MPGTLTAGSFDDVLNLDIKENKEFSALDITFVVDVTGSMGDELHYIQAELQNIVNKIATQFPNVSQHYGLVVYRDAGDEYITKTMDLTESLDDFHKFLLDQRSDGGGDYPEAMHIALEQASSFQWGNDETAKIVFLLADAPPHNEDITATFENVLALKDKKISIYPVAASGAADLAESIMRASAVLTGGQYIFITDDSGIGNSHAEPKFPCYHIEKLNDTIVRAVSDKITGKRSDPVTENIIRTVGHPKEGICVNIEQ